MDGKKSDLENRFHGRLSLSDISLIRNPADFEKGPVVKGTGKEISSNNSGDFERRGGYGRLCRKSSLN